MLAKKLVLGPPFAIRQQVECMVVLTILFAVLKTIFVFALKFSGALSGLLISALMSMRPVWTTCITLCIASVMLMLGVLFLFITSGSVYLVPPVAYGTMDIMNRCLGLMFSIPVQQAPVTVLNTRRGDPDADRSLINLGQCVPIKCI